MGKEWLAQFFIFYFLFFIHDFEAKMIQDPFATRPSASARSFQADSVVRSIMYVQILKNKSSVLEPSYIFSSGLAKPAGLLDRSSNQNEPAVRKYD